jgi:hypothetical protein
VEDLSRSSPWRKASLAPAGVQAPGFASSFIFLALTFSQPQQISGFSRSHQQTETLPQLDVDCDLAFSLRAGLSIRLALSWLLLNA